MITIHTHINCLTDKMLCQLIIIHLCKPVSLTVHFTKTNQWLGTAGMLPILSKIENLLVNL